MIHALAVPAAAATVVAAGLGGLLALHSGAAVTDVASLLFVVACGVAGGLVARQRPTDRVGPLLLGAGLSFAVAEACGRTALALPDGPLAAALGWPQTWLWVPGNTCLALVPLALAEPASRLRRAVGGAVLVAGVVTAPLAALRPGVDRQPGVPSRPNALGVPALQGWVDPIAAAFTLVVGAAFLVGGALVARRWWRTPRQDPLRHRLQWPMWALVVACATVLLRLVSGLLDDDPALWPVGAPVWEVAGSAAAALPPVAVAVGLVRHRIVDIDRLAGRTLLYGGLTATVLAAYLAVVTAAVHVLGPAAGLPASALVAAGAAVGAEPLRRRWQRRVDRLLYGERGDPYAVLAGLGARLESVADRAALADVAEAVRTSLRLSAVVVVGPDGVLATAGSPPGEPEVVPLRAGGDRVGELRLAGRETRARRDRALLAEIARPIAAVVRAVAEAERADRLTADLRRSRQRLVLAAEEERRRLRRDLHDGLGPTLAGLALRAEAARELGDDAAGRVLLDEIVADTATALADVRRLVDGLRPPALDTLGLVGALRAHLSARPPGTAPVDLEDALGDAPLPAAAEVAAFRIAVEAVANADRHARARRIRVAVRGPVPLWLRVADDGVGLPAHPRAGVGLGSMRERAAELGGRCTVRGVTEGGTEVIVCLP
ncbi:histidine kinase [Pseudonocardia oroxyli]|uniref:histidine kinase n=1 Tax=Pseudonocardia oroxyli TaxID=366584 RepID=UPI000B2D9BB1|nr:histidine kinase [Pseudonocardia oroxyli]